MKLILLSLLLKSSLRNDCLDEFLAESPGACIESIELRVTQFSKDLAMFWLEARGEKDLPSYKDIYPERLGNLLPTVFCLKWGDDGALVNQMLGTEISEVLGCEKTGGDFLTFSHPKALEPSREFLKRVCEHPCAGVSVLVFRGRAGIPQEFEIIYFPVETNGVHNRIIGAIQSRNVAYQPGDMDGDTQVIRYSGSSFVDVGSGTPEVGGILTGAGVMSIQELLSATAKSGPGDSWQSVKDAVSG